MENASKALLMAGGMLLVMLIVGLLIFARSRIGDFYNQEKNLSEIKDVSEFNSEFANYERNGVYGYELLSLANRVADYNNRFSNDSNAQNDLKYNPIKLTINMNKKNNNLARDSNATFIKLNIYETSSVNSSFTSILDTMNKAEQDFGKENLQNLSKSIQDIYLDTDESIEEKKDMVSKFNTITLKKNVADNIQRSFYNTVKNCNYENQTDVENKYKMIRDNNNLRTATYQYYEYTQFKKAKFNCDTSATQYDSVSGRIKQMKFVFTGDIE